MPTNLFNAGIAVSLVMPAQAVSQTEERTIATHLFVKRAAGEPRLRLSRQHAALPASGVPSLALGQAAGLALRDPLFGPLPDVLAQHLPHFR